MVLTARLFDGGKTIPRSRHIELALRLAIIQQKTPRTPSNF
jgi:hypothetical protein